MTKFEEIYELNAEIMSSEKIIQAPLYKKYNILYKFLQFAISEFNTRCYKDLKTRENFKYSTESIVGNGLDTQIGLSSPLSLFTEVYIEKETGPRTAIYRELPSTEYIVNKESNMVTLNTPSEENVRYNIYIYMVGYFYDDLEDEEKSILAQGMLIPYIQNEEYRSENLTQQMYGAGAKMYSQAEHNKRLDAMLTAAQYELTTKINAYTYSSDPELVLIKNKKQKEIIKNYR